MKITTKSILFFCAIFMLHGISSAQTITINSFTPDTVCGGSTITVYFTVTGSNWGHKNAFTLQVSDKTGSFSAFSNVGSIKKEVPGAYSIAWVTPTIIENNFPFTSTYKVRIIGASPIPGSPYVESPDTGSIIINTPPAALNIPDTIPINPALRIDTTYDGLINPTMYSLFWSDNGHPNFYTFGRIDFDFGDGANPPTRSISNVQKSTSYSCGALTYSTPGYKTVRVTYIDIINYSLESLTPVYYTTSCNIDTFLTFHVFQCPGHPTIPKYTTVDSGQDMLFDTTQIVVDTIFSLDTTTGLITSVLDTVLFNDSIPLQGIDNRVWINPGITYITPDVARDTFFCESGSSLILTGERCVVYLKPGASYTCMNGEGNTIYYADNTSIIGIASDTMVPCSSITTFDLTDAPPNKAFPKIESVNVRKLDPILIVPNPTASYITVKNIPAYTISMTVFNAIGSQVMEILPHGESSEKLDLSKFESGTYFLRILSENGVITKKIIKE